MISDQEEVRLIRELQFQYVRDLFLAPLRSRSIRELDRRLKRMNRHSRFNVRRTFKLKGLDN